MHTPHTQKHPKSCPHFILGKPVMDRALRSAHSAFCTMLHFILLQTVKCDIQRCAGAAACVSSTSLSQPHAQTDTRPLSLSLFRPLNFKPPPLLSPLSLDVLYGCIQEQPSSRWEEETTTLAGPSNEWGVCRNPGLVQQVQMITKGPADDAPLCEQEPPNGVNVVAVPRQFLLPVNGCCRGKGRGGRECEGGGGE